eukprot:jgi/Mesen1/3736/ME000204S02997
MMTARAVKDVIRRKNWGVCSYVFDSCSLKVVTLDSKLAPTSITKTLRVIEFGLPQNGDSSAARAEHLCPSDLHLRDFFPKFRLSQRFHEWQACSTAVQFQHIHHYSSSTNTTPEWDGGESVVIEMIRYCQSCRAKGPDEAMRIVEQGLSFLEKDKRSSETAAGRLLLMLATLHADSGENAKAEETLKQAVALTLASPVVRVAAGEALCALYLFRHQDGDAHEVAARAVQVAVESAKQGWAQDVSNDLHAPKKLLGVAENAWDAGGGPSSGAAAALLAQAQSRHTSGLTEEAVELYTRSLELARRAAAGVPEVPVTACAMGPLETVVGALAGLAQSHLAAGKFEEAEAELTEALKQAEGIGGGRHARVGAVLALLAQLYARQAQALVAEGLFRRALELMGVPSLGGAANAEVVAKCGLGDLVALTQVHYADLLSKSENRRGEASSLQSAAERLWQGPPTFGAILPPSAHAETAGKEPPDETGPAFPVVDLRLGRVLM